MQCDSCGPELNTLRSLGELIRIIHERGWVFRSQSKIVPERMTRREAHEGCKPGTNFYVEIIPADHASIKYGYPYNPLPMFIARGQDFEMTFREAFDKWARAHDEC